MVGIEVAGRIREQLANVTAPFPTRKIHHDDGVSGSEIDSNQQYPQMDLEAQPQFRQT